MIKIKFSVLLLLMSVLSLNGQAPFPKKDEINQFMVSKTCVVLESRRQSVYNACIKKAVETYWNITPYEFIDSTEFEKRQYDPDYSFILLTQTNYDKDKAQTVYNFLNLLQGKNVSKLGELPEICAIPLSFADDDDFDYSYKLGAILFFMQQHAKMIYENPSLTGRKYLRYYNINMPKVKQKTILVKEEDLSPAIAEINKVKAIYPHKIEIVDEEAIIKAIQEKTPNTLILHRVGPGEDKNSGLCFKMLIGADDSDMYYYNEHKITKSNPNGLLPNDLKRMAK
jgi:hypothetical protein